MATKPSENLERVLGMLEALKSDVRTASSQLAYSGITISDFDSQRNRALSSATAREAYTSFSMESLQSNPDHSKTNEEISRSLHNLRSPSESLIEESCGFIDEPRGASPIQQNRLNDYEFPLKLRYETASQHIPSPASSQNDSRSMYGQKLQESQRFTSKSLHESGERTNLKLPIFPLLNEVVDDSRTPRVFIDEMHKDLQNTLHQLKVLHAFPPGSNFEVEHSGLVQSIRSMTKQLDSLLESNCLNDSLKSQGAVDKMTTNDLRDLVFRAVNFDTLPSHHSFADAHQSDVSSIRCTRSNLICTIRECVSKARSEWLAEQKQLEEKLLKSNQEIKMIRHEAANSIEQATSRYKEADMVWESTHTQHMITIGNLREQLHNITVRYSNLKVESQAELEFQAKDFRQQISHLQGQVSALKLVADTHNFQNSEETRRYEALRVEHDKLLQSLSSLPQKDQKYEALWEEHSKINLLLQQKEADHEALLLRYSNLQNMFEQQQVNYQQLVVNSASSKNSEEIYELRNQNSNLLKDQQNIRDAIAESLRVSSAFEQENSRLRQYLDQKSLEIAEKDDEIRKHELFQLEFAETEKKKELDCIAILKETRAAYSSLSCIPQDSQTHHLDLTDLCTLIKSDVDIMLDRQANLEKTVIELRQRIKVLRTQAKVASSNALKDTEDRIYEVESAMDHTVEAALRQKILAAVDGAKSQLRDLNVAHEHNYVLGTHEIRDQLYKNIMDSNIRDRSLRTSISEIFQKSEKRVGHNATR